MTDKIGQQVGNYRLVRLLASRTFADVYLGEHVQIQHMQSAIKILKVNLPPIIKHGFCRKQKPSHA